MKLSAPAHASLLALQTPTGRRGVLLTGPSGSGKSAMALSLLRGPFRLVADDRVLVWRSGARVFGRAPEVLAGLIEVRGYGVVRVPHLPFAPIDLVVEAVADEGQEDRTPPERVTVILDVEVRIMGLRLDASGARHKVAAALTARPV